MDGGNRKYEQLNDNDVIIQPDVPISLEFQHVDFVTDSSDKQQRTGNFSSALFSQGPSQPPPVLNTGSPFVDETANQSKPSGGFFSLERYSHYFNVDTEQVLARMLATILPKQNFMDVMQGNPDLWGPFWIPTTVFLVMFVTSSIASSIANYFSTSNNSFDFTLLSFAASTCYIYVGGMSLLIWGASRYYGCKATMLDTVALYGYSFTIWIPISIVCIAPFEVAKWACVLGAFGSTSFFLVRNFLPILASAQSHVAKGLIIVIVACQFALAIIFKLYFFNYQIIPTSN